MLSLFYIDKIIVLGFHACGFILITTQIRTPGRLKKIACPKTVIHIRGSQHLPI
jgi:hypothetical protein